VFRAVSVHAAGRALAAVTLPDRRPRDAAAAALAVVFPLPPLGDAATLDVTVRADSTRLAPLQARIATTLLKGDGVAAPAAVAAAGGSGDAHAAAVVPLAATLSLATLADFTCVGAAFSYLAVYVTAVAGSGPGSAAPEEVLLLVGVPQAAFDAAARGDAGALPFPRAVVVAIAPDGGSQCLYRVAQLAREPLPPAVEAASRAALVFAHACTHPAVRAPRHAVGGVDVRALDGSLRAVADAGAPGEYPFFVSGAAPAARSRGGGGGGGASGSSTAAAAPDLVLTHLLEAADDSHPYAGLRLARAAPADPSQPVLAVLAAWPREVFAVHRSQLINGAAVLSRAPAPMGGARACMSAKRRRGAAPPAPPDTPLRFPALLGRAGCAGVLLVVDATSAGDVLDGAGEEAALLARLVRKMNANEEVLLACVRARLPLSSADHDDDDAATAASALSSSAGMRVVVALAVHTLTRPDAARELLRDTFLPLVDPATGAQQSLPDALCAAVRGAADA
jgi:hypothetical protein